MKPEPITTEQTRAIHEYYCSLVASEGLGVPYTMTLHFRFESFLAAGYSKTDLALVVGYIKRRIREGKREKESLLIRNLIGSEDAFAENLSMAESESRAPDRNSPRAIAIRSAGLEPEIKDATVSAGLALERTKLAQQLKEWKEKNL